MSEETKERNELTSSAWLAHLEWLKELTYNYGHDEHCSGQCGPVGEGWVEHDKCDCWHKEIWDLIEANK